jgi:hypothetical protein
MTNLMQIAARGQQSDWMRTMWTQDQVSPYDWSPNAIAEVVAACSGEPLYDEWEAVVARDAGYWL